MRITEVLKRGLDGILRYTEKDVDGTSIYKKFELSELPAENQSGFLQNVTIKGDRKEAIKEELRWLGITYKSINPDLDGLCKSIEEVYNYNHVLKRIK